MELRLEQAHRATYDFVDLDSREFWRRHFRKIAEPVHDGIQIRQFGFERSRGFIENFQKLFISKLTRALHVLYSNLQREERVAQLVCQSPSKFAPRGDALGLHQPLALRGKRL